MENRERQNRLTLRLSDDELYILEQKCKASNSYPFQRNQPGNLYGQGSAAY